LREDLKNDAAILSLPGNCVSIDQELAVRRRENTREQVEYRGLAAARGAQHAMEFGGRHTEADILHRQ